jgi:hypothetical protein
LASSGSRYQHATQALGAVAGGLAAAAVISFFVEGHPRELALAFGPTGLSLRGTFQ